MEKAKHTPGPWRVGDAGRTIFQPVGIKAVAYCDKTENFRANARLIAAAPDLLEALERILGAARGTMDEVRARHEARAAIAKAKGE